jgi:hypothetical protein
VLAILAFRDAEADGVPFPRWHDAAVGRRLAAVWNRKPERERNALLVHRQWLLMHPERQQEAHRRPIPKARFYQYARATLAEQQLPAYLVEPRLAAMWAAVRGGESWDGNGVSPLFSNDF